MPRSSKLSKRFSNKKLKKIFLILMLCGVLYYLFFGSYGFINIFKLKRKEINLRKQKQEFLQKEQALLDSLKKIKSDTFLLEKIAREKSGMIKPGDTVIIFEDK